MHDYGTAHGADGWELLWAHFLPRPHWQEWLTAWPDATPDLCHFPLAAPPERAEVARCLASMHGHAIAGYPRRDDFAMNALEEALLRCDHVQFPDGNERFDPRVLRVRTFLMERLATPVSLADAARAADLSVSRLAHLFREQTGHTPQQFLEEARMARACQLLARTTRPIAAIAEAVGYESPFYFSLRFKKRIGLSPRDWRRERQTDTPTRDDLSSV
jgi:AraC family transcriptional regulator of arabinose operon